MIVRADQREVLEHIGRQDAIVELKLDDVLVALGRNSTGCATSAPRSAPAAKPAAEAASASEIANATGRARDRKTTKASARKLAAAAIHDGSAGAMK